MTSPARPNPSPDRDAAIRVASTLREQGHIAYFAGGCVRDELLGRAPKDYDVATDATPDRVQSLFTRTAHVGAHFGVTLVKHHQTVIEVATFRADGTYDDNRRPSEVVFSDPPTDAQRRDFTINALFLDPFATDGDGVIDYVGGRDDLEARVIRAVGNPDDRLAEDHLRALRAVRFSATLSFDLDPATGDAIRTHARDLAGVSRERIGDELRRMLELPTRADAIGLLESLELDGPVLNEQTRRSDLRAMDALPSDAGAPLAIAAWLIARAEPPTLDALAGPLAQAPASNAIGRVRKALCLTNEERDELARILDGARTLGLPDAPEGWGAQPVARRKRLAASPTFNASRHLVASLTPTLDASIETDVRSLNDTPSGLVPAPLIDGSDLIRLGWPPSPTFGRVLEAVYDAQLEDRVATRDEALELARQLGVQ